jgi:plastocyanin
MSRKFAVLILALVTAALVACGGRAGSGLSGPSGSYMLPSFDRDLAVSATVPKHTIGEELPSEGLGRIDMKKWGAIVGGYTQMTHSQILAFPPGTTITIHHLSKINEHTLNVVKVITGHHADFPTNVTLSTQAHGGDKLATGYTSGVIKPGKSVTVHLDKEGTYLIGCAFHYYYSGTSQMRDILIVSKHAMPGPQATEDPSPTPTSKPTSMPTNPGGW